MRILVAEDEVELNRYDVAVLDIMMPRLDGLTVLRRFREGGGNTPVLFLTARDAVEDRVTGLDSGADDYLVKPFSFQELLARIRVLIRRSGQSDSNQLRVDDLVLDLSSHRVWRAGVEIELSAKEYSILEYMMLNEGRILQRESFRSHVWSWDYDGESNVVDVYIRFLRRKIDEGHERRLIHTVRGAGYMIRGNG